MGYFKIGEGRGGKGAGDAAKSNFGIDFGERSFRVRVHRQIVVGV